MTIARQLPSMNLLLVEDDILLAKGTAKLVEKLSVHRVRITSKPAILMELCQAGKVDLVIMDINLPGAVWQGSEVSGADLSQFLKSQDSTCHVPVVLLTAYVMASERQSLLEAALADDFWTKPIVNYDKFVQSLNRLLEAKAHAANDTEPY
ncbi:response regulator [Synechococcus sp. PCC 7336]|uniref:response regulator n=1 Tax=Synechococcus sp. PCC 7336 TaxID=195250 RepID=UPI00034A10BE|nr:response regulator [Synechococcus sp. PCC 7336]